MMQRIIILALFCAVATAQTYGNYFDQINAAANQDKTGLDKSDKLLELVLGVKEQIKEAITEVAEQVFEYVKNFLHLLKIKFFKKIGKFTLGHIFKVIFSGVTDALKEESFEPEDDDSTFGRPTSFNSFFKSLTDDSLSIPRRIVTQQ